MILHSLRVKNIRSYEDETISFPLGTTLFEGDIGSGKSTILMAIEFALFGLGSQKGASLLRMGAKKGSATLVFEVDGEKYEVHRTLVRKGRRVHQGEGYLKSRHGKDPLAPSELKERILDILQFKEPADPKAHSVIYRYAVFTPQEEMKAILALSPTVRLQTLRKAFGIEDYKIASDNALSLSRAIENKATKLEGQITDLDEKRAELEEKKRSLSENEKSLENLVDQEDKLEKKHAREKKKMDKLREKEKRLEGIKREIPHLETQIDSKKAEIKRLQGEIEELQHEVDSEIMPEMEDLKKVIKPTEKEEHVIQEDIERLRRLEKEQTKLQTKISALEEQVKTLEKKVGDYKNKTLDDVSADIKAIEEQIGRITQEIDSNNKSLGRVTQEKNTIEARIADIKKNLEDLKGAGSICPICDRKLTDEHKRNLEKERKEAISELTKQLDSRIELEEELRGKIRSAEENVEKLRENNRILKKIKEDLTELIDKRKQLKAGQTTLQEIEKQMYIEEEKGFPGISRFESPLKYLEALLEQLRRFNSAQKRLIELEKQLQKNKNKIKKNQRNVKVATAELSKLEKKLKKIRKELEKLADVSTEIAELTERIDAIEKELQHLRGNISSTKTLIETLNDDIQKLDEEIRVKEELKALRKKLIDYCHWIKEYFVPTLGIIEKHVMVSINQEFNQHFQRWFNLLVEEPDKDARIDEDFTPIVEQDGYEQNVDFLSGGEKTSVALAYRLALNNIVQKVSTGMKSNLLILDEPTDGFSKEQLFKVREIFDELSSPQIIIVSHERELESFADHLFKVEKSQGSSKIIGG